MSASICRAGTRHRGTAYTKKYKTRCNRALVSLAAQCGSRVDHHPSGKVYRARRDDSPKECEEKGSQKVVVVGEVLWVFPFFFFFSDLTSSRAATDPGHVQRTQERERREGGEEREAGERWQVRNAGNDRTGRGKQGDKELAGWKTSPSFVAAAAGSRRTELQRRDVTLLRACSRNLPACRSSSCALWRGDPREWQSV